MNSIQQRLLASNAIILAVFVIFISAALSWVLYQRDREAAFQRLEALSYSLLVATDYDIEQTYWADSQNNSGQSKKERFYINEAVLRDPAITIPSSGFVAELYNENGVRVWRNTGQGMPVPALKDIDIAEVHRDINKDHDQPHLRMQSKYGWLTPQGMKTFTIQLVDQTGNLATQQGLFNQNLVVALGLAALLLIGMQLLLMRIAIKPLRALENEVAELETGKREALSESVPSEIHPIARRFNALIRSERFRQTQYRHLVDDLAHTLKTPLSVLKNISVAEESKHESQAQLDEQTAQMQNSIERYIERARLQGPQYMGPANKVKPIIERVTSSMQKLYGRTEQVEFDLAELNDDLAVFIDTADLYELFGNLIDNACKYGRKNEGKLVVSISCDLGSATIKIGDNGPGFGDASPNNLLQRGARADLTQAGKGSGLAACQQIMQAHGGDLSLSNKKQGGALATLVFAQGLATI